LQKGEGIWLPGVSPEKCWPPAPQGVEDEAVEDVAEAVRVEEVLGHPVKQAKVRTSAKLQLRKKAFQPIFRVADTPCTVKKG
jgi:hypothetical protein